MDIGKMIAEMTADEIITTLRKRNTPLPDANALLRDWLPERHDVMDPQIRKDKRVITKEEVRNADGKIIQSAKYETELVNRISLPIEQDQVNIHTAFTVGIEPDLLCEPNSDDEEKLFSTIKLINKKNKIKFQNKKIVRSWLSETEVCEYWYTEEDETFWDKVSAKTKKNFRVKPKRKLKCAIWSPFRGDKLYPIFKNGRTLDVMSREYETIDIDGNKVGNFMTITDTMVYHWVNHNGWKLDLRKTFAHNFSKMPVIYSYRKQGSLCKNIKTIRARLETLLSNYADCIDYNFFPRLVMSGGELDGRPSKENGQMIKIDGEAKVYYLTWNQVPDSVRLELEGLFEKAYSFTGTPRISFENLKGMGQASGVAFKFVFMGTHLEVSNHAEDIEEFLQRRYNFLTTAVGDICVEFEEASKTIDIEPEIIPYMIDNLADKVQTAVNAVGGGIASKKTGVVLAGIVDEASDEVEQIEEEQRNVA